MVQSAICRDMSSMDHSAAIMLRCGLDDERWDGFCGVVDRVLFVFFFVAVEQVVFLLRTG